MILSVLVALALPKRPSYTYRAGESVRYAWRSGHAERALTAMVRVDVVRVGRDGRADLLLSIADFSNGAKPIERELLAVDRWLGRTERGDHPSTVIDVLRLEKPGDRKTGTYTLVPGDGETSVYEVRDRHPGTGPTAGEWRRTIVLDGSGWPLSAETRSTFEDGTVISSLLTRLPR